MAKNVEDTGYTEAQMDFYNNVYMPLVDMAAARVEKQFKAANKTPDKRPIDRRRKIHPPQNNCEN